MLGVKGRMEKLESGLNVDGYISFKQVIPG